MNVPGFACFDVETTGLDADRDRVIEVAVVRTTASGEVTGEWSTLVDAGLDDQELGARHIHGITRDMLDGAPGFRQVADALLRELSGSVPVAHNAGFDTRFLRAEWGRLDSGELELDALDTLWMARQLGLPGRLGLLARDLGVPLVDAHQALDDARALAGVLTALLARGAPRREVAPFQPPMHALGASSAERRRPEHDG